MNNEADIRSLYEHFVAAMKDKDIDAIMQRYTDDIVAFDAIKALQFIGKDAYRSHWQECLGFCEGPGIFEIHQLKIETGENLAWAHCLARCGESEERSGYMRASTCYRRVDGQWKVAHEHWSAPFDMTTNQALFDLQP